MKRLATIATLLLCSFASKSQEPKSTTISVYGNYMFRDKVNFDAYYAYVNEAPQYGAGIEHFLHRNRSIELKYLRTNTHFPLYSPSGVVQNDGADAGSLNYILMGGNNYFSNDIKAKILPYAGLDIGVGFISGEKETEAKFAWDAKLGIKIKTNSGISFKLQATCQSLISTFGTDYWRTYYGTLIAVPDYATIFQFGLGGAVCFDFGK